MLDCAHCPPCPPLVNLGLSSLVAVSAVHLLYKGAKGARTTSPTQVFGSLHPTVLLAWHYFLMDGFALSLTYSLSLSLTRTWARLFLPSDLRIVFFVIYKPWNSRLKISLYFTSTLTTQPILTQHYIKLPSWGWSYYHCSQYFVDYHCYYFSLYPNRRVGAEVSLLNPHYIHKIYKSATAVKQSKPANWQGQ